MIWPAVPSGFTESHCVTGILSLAQRNHSVPKETTHVERHIMQLKGSIHRVGKYSVHIVLEEETNELFQGSKRKKPEAEVENRNQVSKSSI